MSALAAYTLIHVAISLVGIVSGFGFAYALITSRPQPAWTATFFASTVLTSLTGFGFPNLHLTPGVIIGLISLGLFALAAYARYREHAQGGWRVAYVLSSLVAFYLNFLVLVVQSYQKIPALHAIAQTEVVAQLVVLVAFLIAGYFAVRRYHATPSLTSAA
ncbi:hypothetical protein LOC68_03815 [Blastopirellula sp. JC732]|uniref:Uncharacterized protein n=1 Tax=Blastopirellula sediminis TaxID=2894196 RepID=A0A9X1MJV3_9BACT|nr:hypothetical protein [Blastopirellula sediminis]MCC9609714.1 hypothetical protein [Blastopirellula sediminis]MCC9627510.1 hypothetical protein [Blastopirellula sediminis]